MLKAPVSLNGEKTAEHKVFDDVQDMIHVPPEKVRCCAAPNFLVYKYWSFIKLLSHKTKCFEHSKYPDKRPMPFLVFSFQALRV